MTRYAIYFAPAAESALWQFGSAVIGYDAASGRDVAHWQGSGLAPEDWSTITTEPRRYGFHATLKAPFELLEDCDEARLLEDTGALAARLSPVSIGALEVRELGRFIALVPKAASAELQALAGNVVTGLDHLRAAMGEADRQRRLKSPLTARQTELLDRYGYPYVLEQFRFHMTLTGPIADPNVRARVRGVLGQGYAEVVPPEAVMIDALAIYRQDARDKRFRVIERVDLGFRRD